VSAREGRPSASGHRERSRLLPSSTGSRRDLRAPAREHTERCSPLEGPAEFGNLLKPRNLVRSPFRHLHSTWPEDVLERDFLPSVCRGSPGRRSRAARPRRKAPRRLRGAGTRYIKLGQLLRPPRSASACLHRGARSFRTGSPMAFEEVLLEQELESPRGPLKINPSCRLRLHCPGLPRALEAWRLPKGLEGEVAVKVVKLGSESKSTSRS
jgi:hypothetical protein